MTVDETHSANAAPKPGELPPSMTVHEAAQTLSEAGLAAAIVIDNHRPIGIVTLDALSSCDRASPEATIEEMMDYEAVHIGPGCSVEDTMRAFRAAAWHSLWRRRPLGHRSLS